MSIPPPDVDFTELEEFYGNLTLMLSLCCSLEVKQHRLQSLHYFLLATKNAYQQENESTGPLYSEAEKTAVSLASAYLEPKAEAMTSSVLKDFADDHSMIMTTLGYSYSRELTATTVQRLQRLSESSFTRWASARQNQDEYTENEIRTQMKNKILEDAVLISVFKSVAEELRQLNEEGVLVYESVPLSWRLSMIGFHETDDDKFNFGFFYQALTTTGLDVMLPSDDKKKWAVLATK